MKLTSLLRLQVLYAALGVGYNIVSYARLASGLPGLAFVNPIAGSATMLAYALMLLPGFYRKPTLYRVLMGFCVIALGYVGVVVHIVNAFGGNMNLYSGTAGWALAILINSFGLALNLIAAAGRFKEGE